nr:MAG TPA: hypothetical protein [Caudoviricetes sp.]
MTLKISFLKKIYFLYEKLLFRVIFTFTLKSVFLYIRITFKSQRSHFEFRILVFFFIKKK